MRTTIGFNYKINSFWVTNIYGKVPIGLYISKKILNVSVYIDFGIQIRYVISKQKDKIVGN